jgi:phospholipid/cholesterol/gamma-HCH transport system permease protein
MKRILNIFTSILARVRKPPEDPLARVFRKEEKSACKDEEDFVVCVANRTFDQLSVSLSGKISMDNADRVHRDLTAIMRAQPMKHMIIDLSAVEYLDSSGAAVLVEMYRLSEELQNTLKLVNVPRRVSNFLDLVEFDHLKSAGILEPREESSVLAQIGDGTLVFRQNVRDIFIFIGAAALALTQDLVQFPRLKWDRLWKLISRSGADAVPIVTVLSFLMGAILAFQAAIQLRKFGANLFVADLVSVAICLEMGPLMTAMILSGRSGAAFAAEIGTMQVNEEIDALRVMAIDPIRYLVSPRIVSVALMLPCLTLFADLVGVFGGCLVAMFSLDLTPNAYFSQVHKILEVSDVAKGLLKSFVFGIEIALIGCLRGFQVRGGAESVGQATTSTVVTCIFVLTVTDALFAVLFHHVPHLWAP